MRNMIALIMMMGNNDDSCGDSQNADDNDKDAEADNNNST